MARTRTPRNLASRVDLHYFQRPHPFRTAKRSATIAALALAIGWPLLSAALKNKDLYTSGPLAISHAILERNCSACHTGPVAGAGARGSRKAEGERAFFRRHASAAACLLCHAAAGHHEGRAAVAAASVDCADCHREHGGRRELRRVADGGCTQCHANLRTQGEPSFVREITRFRNGGHPEIALLRLKRKDSASIRFNHRAHLEKDVARPEGTVQLVCDDCHRPESDGRPWRFGEGDLQSEGQDAALARTLEAAYMAPVRYREHCSACHTLEFDPRHPGVKSPHDRMEVVHEFLLGYYRAAAGGASVRSRTNRDTPEPRRRGRAGDRARLLPREAGVAIEVESAETLLLRKNCKLCHILLPGAGELPAVSPPNIPARWLAHSRFDHKAHRALICEACHEQVSGSQETADILLPGIETCFGCHAGTDTETFFQRAAGARNDCAECHLYHDRSQEQGLEGRYSAPELSGRPPNRRPQ